MFCDNGFLVTEPTGYKVYQSDYKTMQISISGNNLNFKFCPKKLKKRTYSKDFGMLSKKFVIVD